MDLIPSRTALTALVPALQVQNAVEAGNAKAALAKQQAVVVEVERGGGGGGGLTQQQVQEMEAVQTAARANALLEMEQVRTVEVTCIPPSLASS